VLGKVSLGRGACPCVDLCRRRLARFFVCILISQFGFCVSLQCASTCLPCHLATRNATSTPATQWSSLPSAYVALAHTTFLAYIRIRAAYMCAPAHARTDVRTYTHVGTYACTCTCTQASAAAEAAHNQSSRGGCSYRLHRQLHSCR
jgi:hypothetical protein